MVETGTTSIVDLLVKLTKQLEVEIPTSDIETITSLVISLLRKAVAPATSHPYGMASHPYGMASGSGGATSGSGGATTTTITMPTPKSEEGLEDASILQLVEKINRGDVGKAEGLIALKHFLEREKAVRSKSQSHITTLQKEISRIEEELVNLL